MVVPRLPALFGAMLLLATSATLAERPQTPAPVPTPEQAAFFESRVRPVLAQNCYGCHGADVQLAGLRLDSREAMLKGGAQGAAITPSNPTKSLLVKAIHQDGPLKMPKGRKLKANEIADLEAWIAMGAPWPAKGTSVAAKPTLWSLQPVATPTIPTVKNSNWARGPIDRFVLARLRSEKLMPAAEADRRTLIRRATYDLIGLPPTAAEVDAFVADKSPDAYGKLIDRLLASPHYGERWGRIWLDVARYADTKGYVFEEDRNYPNAYTYRAWVIEALNRDLPYDQFVTQQLAADRLPAVRDGEDKRPLAALGFLTLGRRFLNSTPDIIDDRIDVTMRGLQGFTVACARCHDHKFDPIPTQDYYSLYGVFNSSRETSPPISERAVRDPWLAYNGKLTTTESQIREQVLGGIRELRKSTPSDQVKAVLQGLREDQEPQGDVRKKLVEAFPGPQKSRLEQLQLAAEELKKTAPPTPEFAMAMEDSENPGDTVVFRRGNPGNPGDPAPRRFLAALSPAGKERPHWTEGSGRLQLAQAIASRTNPLTARVFVNRIWQGHFGQGIVRTPSDFGNQGDRPTHPELLDYLAATFMADGWSIKRLHRRIMLSATYRQSSVASNAARLKDPDNRLLSHANLRRLDMEQTRDSLMMASGKLDLASIGGRSVDLWSAPFTPRRAVYGFVERQNLPGIFRTFDFASPDTSSPRRFQTIVPQQALFFMNSPLAVEQAKALVERPEIANAKDDRGKVRALFRIVFARQPVPSESETCTTMLKTQPVYRVAQALLMTNEFVYLD